MKPCKLANNTVTARRHRIYKLYGPPAPGKQWLHTCDNQWCWEREHLYQGTPAQNVRDHLARGKTTHTKPAPDKSRRLSKAGEANGRAKLTQQQVGEIRDRFSKGETYKQLALEYGVTREQISHVVRGVAWAKVVVSR